MSVGLLLYLRFVMGAAMRLTPRSMSVLAMLITSLAQGQAIPSPRRISRAFQGELPWVWVLEGSGRLKSASVRLLDEAGKECWSQKGLALTSLGAGQWQAVMRVTPDGSFKGLGSGRYTAEWQMEWVLPNGPRVEETESLVKMEDVGEGWLQQAYSQDPVGAPNLRVGSGWRPGGNVSLDVTSKTPLKRVRYQIIDDTKEQVLRPWTSLSLDKGYQWSLVADPQWPEGMVQIWFEVEGIAGQVWVLSRELMLGSSRLGGLPTSKSSSLVMKPAVQTVAQATVQAVSVAPAAGICPTWLTSLTDPAPPLWESTNRIATVNVGYLDEERNASRLWPSDQGRPMSLGLTGSDGLGRPLYSVSYLLSDWAISTTPIELYADQALLANSGGGALPAGAESLAIGGVTAPVVVSAGVVKDFLDRPLAGGYGWAVSDDSGTLLSAKTWTNPQLATTAPEVGAAAIQKAAAFRQSVLTQSALDVGYGGEGTSLSGRNPFSMTVAAQDSYGRPILSRGIGMMDAAGSGSVMDVLELVQDPGTGANLGLRVKESSLAVPVVPGFTRTQYGTVDLDNHGTCGVSMVTDPDGSAVAEIKDPEGRTIYKIVNPNASYCNLFKDFQNNPFQPAAPKNRGVATGSLTVAQYNLVTQYLFDAEGHLRVVIPPKGVSGMWGVTNPADEVAKIVIQTTVTNGTPIASGVDTSKAIRYATYNIYDFSGHLIGTYNPDEGLMAFRVDQKGRVYFSQTASQRTRGRWTRTYYDQLFRVVAVGEVAATADVVAREDIEGASAFVTGIDVATLDAMTEPAINVYSDDYEALDPTQFGAFEKSVKDLLPSAELWGAFAEGHLTRTEDRNSIERYYYDQDGRISIRWVTIKGVARTPNVSYTGNGDAKVTVTGDRHFVIGVYYDFAGRVKRLVYPNGPGNVPLQIVYTYDDLGRLYAVGTPDDPTYFARYAYLPTGEVRGIVYGPGKGFAAKRMFQDPQGWLRDLTVQGRN